MPPVLGSLIVLAAVALLVRACVRYLVEDERRGGCGGCAGCGGGGSCAHCAGCHAAANRTRPVTHIRKEGVR